MKTYFIIFAHCNQQTLEDIDDMIDNISRFSINYDFGINHPRINHCKVITKHNVGPVDSSNFIFGAFVDIINKLSEEIISDFDHFCLVSANQYFINPLILEQNINYVQFFNTPNWGGTYIGKDTSPIYEYNPLIQHYGVWDDRMLCNELNIPTPMASNWEGACLTKEAIMLCKENINKAIDKYPNCDLMSVFPGYMALKTNQKWNFPSFFGTFDPSSNNKSHLITIDQLEIKHKEKYSSIKRVEYGKGCAIKKYIRENYYK